MVGGVGIPSRFYDGAAYRFAARGHPTLTFDFRGVGASAPRKGMRGFGASMNDWGSKDCAAAIEVLRQRFPSTPMVILAHSFGGFLVGLAESAARIPSAFVLLGPHTGFPGDYLKSKRLSMRLMWHVVMPLAVRVVGYFPGRLLGLPSNLPKTVALEWAGRRDPDIWREMVGTSDRFPREPISILRGRMDRITVPVLAVSAADDAFSTEAGVQRVRTCYRGARFESYVIWPAEYCLDKIGHFRYFSSRMSRFWDEVDKWIGRNVVGRNSA